MLAILTSAGSVEAKKEERVGETGKEDLFIAGGSVGSRPGDWSFSMKRSLLGGQEMPAIVPKFGDEGVVVRFEVVGWN